MTRPLLVLASLLLGAPAFSQTDFSGEWVDRITDDSYERSGVLRSETIRASR